MNLQEYESKYSRRSGRREAGAILRLAVSAVGVVVFCCLAGVVLRVYEVGRIAGHISAGIAVLVFICVYMVPVIKMSSLEAFDLGVTDRKGARAAKRHNRRILHGIADKMIEVSEEVDESRWYPREKVSALSDARSSKDDAALRRVLNDIYSNDVDSAANTMVRNASIKAGVASAVSQSSAYDAIFVSTIDIQLIKDLVFLYGFRPGDAHMARILRTVVVNSLAAYGLNSVKLGSSVVKGLSKYVRMVPMLGNAISIVADSAIQGLTNATLTTYIGIQTKRFLFKEYHLQDILDGVTLPSAEEEERQMNENIEAARKSLKDLSGVNA